jgi:hypothetical protein
MPRRLGNGKEETMKQNNVMTARSEERDKGGEVYPIALSVP